MMQKEPGILGRSPKLPRIEEIGSRRTVDPEVQFRAGRTEPRAIRIIRAFLEDRLSRLGIDEVGSQDKEPGHS